MPSVGLYSSNEQRANCYKCTKKNQEIEVGGKQQRLECRNYTKVGLMLETMSSAQMTELFDKKLIHVLPIGVDTAEFSNEKSLEFRAQSRGGGGLSKYQCGLDYQAPKMIRHKKYAYTERLYVHTNICVQALISTEFQDWAFPNDAYSDRELTNTEFSDTLVLAARFSLAKHVNHADVVGVFGGANEFANAYDGVLAQAYWAYTRNAYFHSLKYTVDEDTLIDGTFMHVKFAGKEIDIEFDSTQPTDADLERYATREEVYARAVNFLNNDVATDGGRKYVDATYYQNMIIVTSKWTAQWINLGITIDANATIDWASCDSQNGVVIETEQGVMPIDERPFLVKYREYTYDNILSALPEDIEKARSEMDSSLLMNQVWALYLDKRVWDMYNFARSQRTQNDPQGNIFADFGDNVFYLDALSANGGTGLWFITAVEAQGANVRFRNIKHVVDTTNVSNPYLGTNQNCRELEMLYDQLHGVFVMDFRKFASNLLCSPFVSNLKEPYEKTIEVLPCYNKQVRDNYMNPISFDNCTIEAQFVKEAEFINEALYALPSPTGTGYDIYVLEEGETKPNGALNVYQIKFKDTTLGIPIDRVGDVVYEYVVTTNDGASATFTSKDFTFSYVGDAAGIALNVEQTVTLDNCVSTFDASTSFAEDFPFVAIGSCSDLTPDFNGYIQKTAYYTVTSDAFNTAATVTGAPDAEIDLSANPDANDAQGAADIINAYFTANSISGLAAGEGNVLTVFSPTVAFVNIDPLGDIDLFDQVHQISMFDNTVYDQYDGLDSIEIDVYCQTQPAPVTPTFTALPSIEPIDTCGAFAGWEVTAIVTTKAGCTFNLSATVNSAAMVDNIVNFTLA